MEIQRIVSDLLESNMYLLTDNDHGIVVDPCEKIPSISVQYDWILLTHEHYDHISGVNVWKKLTGAKVLCNYICAVNIQDPKKNFSRHFEEFVMLQAVFDKFTLSNNRDRDYSCSADIVFSGEKNFTWEGHTLKLFETPGHSDGSSCFLIDNQYFFSGDTLLHNYETALRLPGGSKKKWREITNLKLNNLSEELIVYPGHFEEFKFKDWIGHRS